MIAKLLLSGVLLLISVASAVAPSGEGHTNQALSGQIAASSLDNSRSGDGSLYSYQV